MSWSSDTLSTVVNDRIVTMDDDEGGSDTASEKQAVWWHIVFILIAFQCFAYILTTSSSSVAESHLESKLTAREFPSPCVLIKQSSSSSIGSWLFCWYYAISMCFLVTGCYAFSRLIRNRTITVLSSTFKRWTWGYFLLQRMPSGRSFRCDQRCQHTTCREAGWGVKEAGWKKEWRVTSQRLPFGFFFSAGPDW